MINLVSIVSVLLIHLTVFLILFFTSAEKSSSVSVRRSPLRFWISILGGSLPLGLLGSGVIERDGISVILALIGFAYFILFKKA